jgi:hypothetical protein
MSTPNATVEQFTTLARRSQEATTAAAQGATRALQSYADAVTPRGARPLDPQVAVTAGFDLVEQLLQTQRTYVTTTVALLVEAGETVTAQASVAGETLKARTEEAAERVVDFTAQGTRRAATAARNGVSV